jgi:hypothetical protein
LPSVPDFARHARYFDAKELSWSTIVFSVSFSSRISPRTCTVIFFDKSPFAHGGRDFRDISHLRRQI